MTVQPEAQAIAARAPTPTGVVSCLMVQNADEFSAFCEKAFGGVQAARIPGEDGKTVMHIHMIINGGSFIFNDPFPEHGYPFRPFAGFTLHIQVPHGEGDVWWNRALEAGCTVHMPFEQQFWGDRYGTLADPFGVCWSIGETAAAA